MMDKVILVDGHNLLFRIFFGFSRPIILTDGRDMRCPVGFVSSLNKLIKTIDTNKMLVVFDSETSIRKRLLIDPDYKQNRMDYSTLSDDENPFIQLPLIYKALDHLDIPYVEADGYEADDYIATLCQNSDYDMVIVSTDSDFNQLVSDHVSIYKSRGKQSEWLTPERVYEKLGVHPHQIVEYKSLTGDSADNIKGIKGIGPKRAAEILSYGTLDAIINKETNIPDKYFNKVVEHQMLLKKNKSLIQMIVDVPYKIEIERCHVTFDDFFKATGILKIF